MFSRWMLILLLLLPITLVFQGTSITVAADDRGDAVEGEEDGNVEDEAGDLNVDGAVTGQDAEEDELPKRNSSPDADTYFLFTKPSQTGLGNELPAGKDVSFLVGFANKGTKDFTINSMEASFRYAMDFSYHLQNFSAIAYNRVVRSQEEATLSYSFFVSDAYSARPYGFTVNVYYSDPEGNQYVNAVFNETVTIIELDEGLDGETFFLYVFLGGIVVLAFVGIQQLVSSKRGSSSSSKPKVEMGTTNPNDVDYDWLPQETLNIINQKSSPKSKLSPRQRRVAKRGTGSSDE